MKARKLIQCLLSLSIILGLSLEAMGATKETSTTKAKTLKANAKKSEKAKKLRKKIGVDQSDFMPSEDNFGLITSYVVNYDALQQEKEKTYTHSLSLAGTYSFTKKTSVYGALGLFHQTKNEKIVRENDTDQYHGVSDFNIGGVYSYAPKNKYISRSSNTLNVALPLSERSRFDERIASFSLTNFASSATWNRISLYSRVTANFQWNQLRYSVYNNDTLNRNWLLAGTLGVNYQPFRLLNVRASFSSDNTRYLDGSWDNSFGSRLAMATNLYGFQIFGSLTNHSYPENDRVDVAYYDKYRRVYTLGVTHAF